MIVMSPSNILAHKKCPLQAWGQREKLIAWKESPQKARGTAVHSALEQAVKDKFKPPAALPDGCKPAYISDVMRAMSLEAHMEKMQVMTEQSLAVNRAFKPTNFFADDTFFRCRADLLMVYPDKRGAIIGDWKTGKIYDYSKDQMRLEAVLVYAVFGTPRVDWKLFYVDQGQTKEGTVDFSNGLGAVQDLLEVMQEMQALDKNNGPWSARKNPFCRWCDWYHTECRESRAW